MDRIITLKIKQEDVFLVGGCLSELLAGFNEKVIKDGVYDSVIEFLSDCVIQLSTTKNPNLSLGEAEHLKAEIDCSKVFTECQILELNKTVCNSNVVICFFDDETYMYVHSMSGWKELRKLPINELKAMYGRSD